MHVPLHRVTKKLDGYCVVFSDKSEYYSKLDGFYGIEIYVWRTDLFSQLFLHSFCFACVKYVIFMFKHC